MRGCVVVRWALIVGLAAAGIAGSSKARADAPGRGLGDPAMNIPGVIRGTRFGSVTEGRPITPEVLFGKGGRPFGREMLQRKSSDCYEDSPASVYAEFHPDVIQKVFLNKDGELRTSKDGSPAARFFVKDPETKEYKPTKPTIYRGNAPLDKDGTPVLNQVVDRKIWASQLELSYAKFRNRQGASSDGRTGFNRLVGGYADNVMQALTGKKAETFFFTSSQADEVWAKLLDAQEKNKVVVAGSTTKQGLRTRAKEQIEHGMLDPKVMKNGHVDPESGLAFDPRRWAVGGAWIDGHDYAAWGDKEHPFVFEKNGERLIRLRDPHGQNPPGGEGEDGVGVIPFNQFLLHWDQVEIGAPNAKE